MPRGLRAQEQGAYNHVTARGSGRRQIFEDDSDKEYFIALLKRVALEERISIYAWCLMDNHIHLLLKGQIQDISKMMQRVQTSYAHWFNGRHGHIGHVFQGRFSATPIDTDEHFLLAIKYIHLNPRDMAIDEPLSYPWSSYRQYILQNDDGVCQYNEVLDILGGLNAFKEFHESEENDVDLLALSRARISDAEADRIAMRICGRHYRDSLFLLDPDERRSLLARMRIAGLSIRQIERLTGIGRGVIAKAKL